MVSATELLVRLRTANAREADPCWGGLTGDVSRTSD